jgi:AAA ATPase domain
MESPTAPANSFSASQGDRSLYSSITIEGFRHFKRLELNNLGRINLFLGPNNCGKTSILEAIYTHTCGLSFGRIFDRVVLNRNNNAVSGVLDIGEKLFSLFQDTSSLPYSFTIAAKMAGEPSVETVKSIFYPSSELSELDPRTLGQFTSNLRSDNQA